MKKVDLHTHTTYSDGTFTPEEIVKYAAEKNLSSIAITDHDTVDGIEEGIKYGKKYGVEIIPGIEFSAKYNDINVHILGLFLNPLDIDLNNKLKYIREKRNDRNIKIIEKLKDKNIDISYDYVKSLSGGEVVSRGHIAKAMINKGYCSSVSECFRNFLSQGNSCYVQREVFTYDETINIIHKAGGISVMAHPFLYGLDNNELDKMLYYCKKAGLDGIECFYSTHSENQMRLIKKLSKIHNLCVSGGSDFHGKNKPNIDLGDGCGNLLVEEIVLDKLKECVLNAGKKY